MDLMSQKFYIHVSEAVSPTTSPPTTLFGSPLHSSHTGFPIIAVAIIGILATAFLLVSYYIFVIKCCLNWHRIDLLGRFSFSRRRRVEDPLMVYSAAPENRGLDEAAIRSIPVFQFKKDGAKTERAEKSSSECAVCLNEFQEEEKLRHIPNCGHAFHIDCIDVWLQNSANCPLCRTSISATRPSTSIPLDRNPNHNTDNFPGREEDYVVIEISQQEPTNQSLLRVQERVNSSAELPSPTISPSRRKLEQKIWRKKAKKLCHLSSMGDECIDSRQNDEQFEVHPIRRSFSMDSASDRQLYLAVQEIIQRHNQVTENGPNESCSNRSIRRSFFSFGQGRGSRNAVQVQPVSLEP